ncbi:nucleoporin complex subunit 54-domain-containing protein [Mycena olivaceomarginata]|nr:nucleoporin complex subunit 54-domain-containing protein [Mycena olivaceomarginata]
MSLFGQPQQQTSNIFGGGTTQPATTSIFGQPNTSQQAPSLFGGAANTNTNTNSTGGGLFGGGTNTNAQGASTGLFGGGQQQAQPATGGLFGNTQQSQPAAGGSLFGNPQQQQGQQPASGGLFGNNANAGGGGLFGAAKPAGGLAGAPTLPSLNTGGSSLFGGGSTNGNAQPTQSIFGQPAPGAQQQQQQRPGLFGGAPSSSNIFGASAANANGAPKSAPAFGNSFGLGLGGQQQQQQPNNALARAAQPGQGQGQGQAADAQTQFARLTARIEGIAAAWNAAGPGCQFQYIFYNRVDPAQVGLYGRPPNATNDALWARAVRENPDPSCLVPAIAVGFDDLRQRVDAQGAQAGAHQEKLKELKTRIATLSSTQHQNSARLARLAAAQTQLTHRLLALASHLHLLVPALRSSGIRGEEEELRGWLEELREEVGVRGGGGGRMRGKLGELWALVGALGAAREGAAQSGGGGGEWKVVDEDGLARIAQILSEQQAGLVHLTKILKGDLADINVVLKGGGRQGEEGDGEELWGSRSRR